jgi:hypothetical protein
MEVHMTNVMIRCPNTGQDIFTGVEIHEVRSIPDGPSSVRCPLCGEDHTWSREDARIADDAAASSQAEKPSSSLPAYETVREKLW